MKVVELARRGGRDELSPLKGKVLEYLESHPGEVFSYRDDQLQTALRVKRSALDFTLWTLHRDGLIERETVKGRVYFGSREAIDDVRRRLGIEREDGFQRAIANRDRIWARTGDLDVLGLLDSVRGDWD